MIGTMGKVRCCKRSGVIELKMSCSDAEIIVAVSEETVSNYLERLVFILS